MSDPQKSPIQLRNMTEDERRGFDYALELMKRWANQIEVSMVNVEPIGISVPLECQQANSARMTRSLADALQQGISPAPH